MTTYLVVKVEAKLGTKVLYSFKSKTAIMTSFPIPFPPPLPPFKFSFDMPKIPKMPDLGLPPFGPYNFSKKFTLPPIPPIPPIPPFKIAGIPFPPPIPPLKFSFDLPKVPKIPGFNLSFSFDKRFNLTPPPIPKKPGIPTYKIAGIPFPPPIPPLKLPFSLPKMPGMPSWTIPPFGFYPFPVPSLVVSVTIE